MNDSKRLSRTSFGSEAHIDHKDSAYSEFESLICESMTTYLIIEWVLFDDRVLDSLILVTCKWTFSDNILCEKAALEALQKGDLESILRLMVIGVDMNSMISSTFPLHIAVENVSLIRLKHDF